MLIYALTIVKPADRPKLKRHGSCELCEQSCGIEAESANELVNCILKLPARYRQFILLKYYHGYSTREIAHMLGMSSASVSKTAQRAKQRLEQLCKYHNKNTDAKKGGLSFNISPPF